MEKNLITSTTLTCPLCGKKQEAIMPRDACQYFWLLRTLAEGKCDRMKGSVAKNFEEGKSNEQLIEVGHHARKAAPLLAV